MYREKIDEAFVTIAIGEKYKALYDRCFRESQERLAADTGRSLIVLEDYIDESRLGRERHPAWQKLLIFSSPQTARFQRLCWIDADIYVARHSDDPFNYIHGDMWGAVRNNPYDLENYNLTDPNLYKYCPENNRPSYLLNTGLFILNRKRHSEILNYVYYNYNDQPCYEMGPLSYHLLNSGEGVELDARFNRQICQFIQLHGDGEDVIRRCVRESDFIHFCGGINENILQKVRNYDRSGLGKLFEMIRIKKLFSAE